MNLLENAVEAASQVAPGKERFIRLQMSVRGGFLAIQCENTFQGPLVEKRGGGLLSQKHRPEFHGFGIAKMRSVAEKHKSILDIRYTDTAFTVQTALKLPKESQTPSSPLSCAMGPTSRWGASFIKRSRPRSCATSTGEARTVGGPMRKKKQ